MIDRVGQQLGNYRLQKVLGKGGFAQVYLGEHIHLGTGAAIKILHAQLDNQKAIEKFREEARTIARLIHPNIVRILDFDVAGTTPFLVMDYASNGSLRERYPQGSRLPLGKIVTYMKQAATALQFAHDNKLIHCDVKPHNMLISRHEELLLSDFGIAVVVHNSLSANAQEIQGTALYMAPEQVAAYPRPASDQYALGIVAYEWICGHPPFMGNMAEIALKHQVVEPPSLRAQIPLAPDVEMVIMRALAKDPKQRFPRIQDFALALEQAVQQAESATLVRTPQTGSNSGIPSQQSNIATPIYLNHEGALIRPTSPNTPGSASDTPPPTIPPPPPPISHYAYPQRPVYPRPMYPQPPNYQRPPAKPAVFPLVRGKPKKKDFALIGGYSLMVFATAIPLIAVKNDSAFTNGYSFVMIFGTIPAATLLASKILGSWRSVVQLLLTFVAFMVATTFLDPTSMSFTTLQDSLATLPLWKPLVMFIGTPVVTALIGWIYERPRATGCMTAGWTTALGSFLLTLIIAAMTTTTLTSLVLGIAIFTLLLFLATLTLEGVTYAVVSAIRGISRYIQRKA